MEEKNTNNVSNNPLGLNDGELDALKECGNVGMGNAASTLAKMVDKLVNINIPEVKFIPIKKLSYEVGGPEKLVLGLYADIIGDVKGTAIFMFGENDATHMLNLLGGNSENLSNLKHIDELAIKELSNVFVVSYLKALEDMLDIKIQPSITRGAVDMAQSVLDYIIVTLSERIDHVMIVKETISIDDKNIDGTFLVIFEEESLRTILKKLKEKYGV